MLGGGTVFEGSLNKEYSLLCPFLPHVCFLFALQTLQLTGLFAIF